VSECVRERESKRECVCERERARERARERGRQRAREIERGREHLVKRGLGEHLLDRERVLVRVQRREEVCLA